METVIGLVGDIVNNFKLVLGSFIAGFIVAYLYLGFLGNMVYMAVAMYLLYVLITSGWFKGWLSRVEEKTKTK
jgi:hypothetical protein